MTEDQWKEHYRNSHFSEAFNDYHHLYGRTDLTTDQRAQLKAAVAEIDKKMSI